QLCVHLRAVHVSVHHLDHHRRHHHLLSGARHDYDDAPGLSERCVPGSSRGVVVAARVLPPLARPRRRAWRHASPRRGTETAATQRPLGGANASPRSFRLTIPLTVLPTRQPHHDLNSVPGGIRTHVTGVKGRPGALAPRGFFGVTGRPSYGSR